MLQIGKHNNVVAWNLEMRASMRALYGSASNFLTTNVRYVPPLPREEDYTLVYPNGEDDLPAVAMSAALHEERLLQWPQKTNGTANHR